MFQPGTIYLSTQGNFISQFWRSWKVGHVTFEPETVPGHTTIGITSLYFASSSKLSTTSQQYHRTVTVFTYRLYLRDTYTKHSNLCKLEAEAKICPDDQIFFWKSLKLRGQRSHQKHSLVSSSQGRLMDKRPDITASKYKIGDSNECKLFYIM